MERPSAGRTAGWIAAHSYLLLCLALLPMVAWRAVTGTWLADFWEHAAVVGEFAVRPLDPNHPMLALDAPHALNSPYHLVLGLIAGAFDASPVAVLGMASILNFGVLATGLHRLVRLFTDRTIAPFLALLFTVFLWGLEPWEWSGFYHLISFSNVMAYPSTFATGTACFGIVTAHAHLTGGGWRPATATAALGAVTLLLHPPTFAFLVIGAVAMSLALPLHPTLHRAAVLALALVGAVAVSLAWPYYPLIDLPAADRAGYLRDNDPLLALSGVVSKTFPAFVGLPFLVLRALRNRRDALVLLFLGVSAGYLAARFGGVGSLATTIRFVVLALHIAAADALARLLADAPAVVQRRVVPVGIGVALALTLALTVTALGRDVAALDEDAIPDVAFLSSAVPDDAVVMTDAITALEVPAWGPKVVAWHYAMPYVDDREARRSDVEAYFSAATTADERASILDRWCVGWVLVVPERLGSGADAPTLDELMADGQLVREADDGRSVLVERDAAECATSR
jgi:hypothetical protein